MDIDQARTFLAIVETGSFVEAGKRVHVTQSTVSARIKTLEEQIGNILFTRSKAGATLTPEGERFRKHAQALVRIWQTARLEIALPKGYETALTIGGQYSLWDGYLLDWLANMRAKSPEIAIRAQMGFSDALMQRLIDGTINLGVMYTPQARPGYEVEQLFEDHLVMVANEQRSIGELDSGYAFIDWGPEFRADHTLNFPEMATPGTYLELGSLSLRYIEHTGAAGYVPVRLIRGQLEANTLFRVRGAPVFSYPAYVVYPNDPDQEFVVHALSQLRESALKLQRSA